MLIVGPWVAGGMSRQMIRAMIERGGNDGCKSARTAPSAEGERPARAVKTELPVELAAFVTKVTAAQSRPDPWKTTEPCRDARQD